MHFRTRSELERSMNAARQLRAETLGGVKWIVVAITGAGVLLLSLLRWRRRDTALRT